MEKELREKMLKKEMLIYKKYINEEEYLTGIVKVQEMFYVHFFNQQLGQDNKNYYLDYRDLFDEPNLEIPVQEILNEALLKESESISFEIITTFYIMDKYERKHYFGSTTSYRTNSMSIDEFEQFANTKNKVLKK